MSSRPRYTLVPETLKSFRVLGASTPGSLNVKLDLLSSDSEPSSIAVVVFDAFRCSSTLLACFAAGLHGAVVMEKGVPESGTPVHAAEAYCQRHGIKLLFGGELSGRPIPGGTIGNSPIDAWNQRDLIHGALLHFQSTNFARNFGHVVRAFRAFGEARANAYVISFANASATAEVVRRVGYERVVVVGAGFFECVALEDMVLGGLFADQLGFASGDFDDEARAMIAAYRGTSLETLSDTWTARVLERLSKHADVTDLIGPSRLPTEFADRMAGLVLEVDFHETDLTIIRSSPMHTRG